MALLDAPNPTRTVDPGHLARRDAVARVAAGLTLGASLLLVTVWWAGGGGITALGAWAGALTSVGRLTGLLASVLLLAQVLLMARVPLLEHAFGQDRLVRVHRVVGFTSFTLMIAHVGLVTWGYAGGSLPGVPATAWELTWTYPGMLLAVAGTAALVMVVVTSLRAARARLRYESWHLLHLYAYLGAGLALPHQLWTGQELVSSPGRAAFWWSAWGASALAVVVWRVALPLARAWRHRMVVTEVVAEAPGVVSVHLRGRHLDRLGAHAGQFLAWRFLGRRGWTRAHPFSLSAAPTADRLRITVQEVGDGSSTLRHLRPGTRVLAEGPFGRLSSRARSRRRVALVGAGLGMAPLRSLAEGLEYAAGEAVVLHRFTDDRLFGDELDALARDRGLEVVSLPGPRRGPTSWLGDGVDARVGDLAALRWWVPDIAERDVFLCGPVAWTDLVRADLLRAGLPPEHLHVETFRW